MVVGHIILTQTLESLIELYPDKFFLILPANVSHPNKSNNEIKFVENEHGVFMHLQGSNALY